MTRPRHTTQTAELGPRLRASTDSSLHPAGPAPCLVTLIGDETGRRHQLPPRVLIGRHPDADIYVPSATVSRAHAFIEARDRGVWVLRDNGSRNGTTVNGFPLVGERTLRYGDRITIGGATMLMFCPSDPLEEQLLRSQRMEAFGQLAGGVAHDFNNILTVILGSLELIVADLVPESEWPECAHEALQAAEQGGQLTKQLLNFTRMGACLDESIDVSELAANTLRLVRRTFDRAIQVELQASPGVFVSGDPAQLTQVLMNLCLNARDAMSTGGRLTVSVRRINRVPREAAFGTALNDGPAVQIAVRDTGPGLDAETAKRVFEPFFTTKTNGKGLGLGLATAYGIVRNHGGNTTVDASPGRGATFHVFLPAVDEPAARKPTRSIRAATLNGTVLVIDDEPGVREALGKMVGAVGCKALLADGGEDGIRLYRERMGEITTVVLDVIMPGQGGEETLEQLLAIDPSVKVVVVSGYSHPSKVTRMLQAGARVFLPKPFRRDELADALRRAVHHNGQRPASL